MGELAFAKATGRYPSGLFLDMAEDDDVSGIQVRTRRKHSFELYLWKKDAMDAFYALVTGEGPTFEYRGMIHGEEAMVEKYWREKQPGGFPRVSCFVVPHAALRLAP